MTILTGNMVKRELLPVKSMQKNLKHFDEDSQGRLGRKFNNTVLDLRK
jgi:hypothetical protein